MIISNQRIRLAVDTSQMGTINDVITGNTPQFWNGVDLEFEIALFYGSTLLSISNIASITVDVKQSDPRTGLPVMSQTLSSGSLNGGLTLGAWNGGAPTDCHALVQFPNAQTNLNLSDDTETFWLVISALTSDSPAHKIVLGATPINVTEGGEGVTPPAPVVTPIYFTAAQSDARYARSVDLTSINSSISTLNTEMTAVTTTANAAMPKAGGTFSGAITITGLSGVLKANTGLVAGSATTSDLPEGSNLYYTSARFTAALAAVTNVANGVCGLDSSGLVPVANLPSITVHNTFVVASQAAMLALAAHQGDVAIRTDLNESFILTNNVPTVLGNWSQLLTPTSAVTSVNAQTGAVTLTTSNIAEGSNLYYTTARAKADAIAATLTGFSNATGGNVSSGDSVLVALGRLENRCALNDAKLTGSDRVKIDGSVAMTGHLTFTGTTHPGIILNNLNDTQRAALMPSPGMIIYNTTLSQAMVYNGAWTPLLPGGTNWFNGTGAPASTLGVNGSYYLDNAAGAFYLKSSGSWAIIFTVPSSGAGSMPLAGGSFTGNVGFTGTTFAGLQLNFLTNAQRNALTGAQGQMIYNTDTDQLNFFNGIEWCGWGGGGVSAPTITPGAGAGSLATADTSTDPNATTYSFRVKLVTGATGLSAGSLFTAAFANTIGLNPKINFSVSPGTEIAKMCVDFTAYSGSGFTFKCTSALTPSTTYIIDFILVS